MSARSSIEESLDASRVSDHLWGQLEPLLRIDKPRKKSGRPRISDRRLLEGLIWLSRSGEQWSALPAVFGAKSTCHARFREWVSGGYLAQIWPIVLVEHPDLSEIKWGKDNSGASTSPHRKGPALIRRFPTECATNIVTPGTEDHLG